jgi:CheY-like chemotaxis protein
MNDCRKGRILIVEDEDALIRILDFMLRSRGYEVLPARDGAEGLRLATTERPDLIVLDVMLPLMDGIEVCRRLKADPEYHEIPILLLTAKAQAEDRRRGMEAGADLLLTKPYDRSVLLESVDRLIETGRQRGAA